MVHLFDTFSVLRIYSVNDLFFFLSLPSVYKHGKNKMVRKSGYRICEGAGAPVTHEQNLKQTIHMGVLLEYKTFYTDLVDHFRSDLNEWE